MEPEKKKKGAVMMYKQLQREKILGREREAKRRCRTLAPGKFIPESFLTGRMINPGNKLSSKIGNAPPLGVWWIKTRCLSGGFNQTRSTGVPKAAPSGRVSGQGPGEPG